MVLLVVLASSGAGADGVEAELRSEPGWLFPASICPADLSLPPEAPVRYLGDHCKPRLGECLEACKRSDANACYALALALQDGVEQSAAVGALFLRACKLGVTSGCTNRAAGLPPTDLACANRTYEKSCDRKDAWGCAMLGLSLVKGSGMRADPARARSVLEKACASTVEDDPACRAARSLLQQLESPALPALRR